MINPKNITKYDRNERELQIFWLFCIFVAGKNSDIQCRKLNQFLSRLGKDELPFDYIKNNLLDLRNMLVAAKVGQYNRLVKTIEQSLDLNLATCQINELEKVFGVGPKSSRFFILHTRKNQKHVILDVHILKWLKRFFPNMPKNTPSHKEDYARIENRAIILMKAEFPYLSYSEIDMLLWKKMSGRDEEII